MISSIFSSLLADPTLSKNSESNRGQPVLNTAPVKRQSYTRPVTRLLELKCKIFVYRRGKVIRKFIDSANIFWYKVGWLKEPIGSFPKRIKVKDAKKIKAGAPQITLLTRTRAPIRIIHCVRITKHTGDLFSNTLLTRC